MNALVHDQPNTEAPSRAAVNRQLIALLRAAAIVIAVALSGYVVYEPAPYELFMAGLMPLWALFGLRISRRIAPLLLFIVLFNIGGLISMSQLATLGDIPLYMGVSVFLGLTAVFFAAVIEEQESIVSIIFRTWVVAAAATALLGVLGYFRALPGTELFTLYGRAAGGFQDPNVFGPYLTLPGIYLLHRIMTGSLRVALLAIPPFLFITFGVFLSFSRGAWGLFVVSSVLLILALFLYNRHGLVRLRILIMSAIALLLAALVLVIALQIPAVADLFSQRAQLVQSYDQGRFGRFGRHLIGFALATENPLGIGPLVFGQIYGEDTHNIWLKTLLAYSWLGFAAYFILIVWTIAGAFRYIFRARPWQPYFLCTYIVFVGHVALGAVIDTDHWRHFYLRLGMLWGMMALEQRQQAQDQRETVTAADQER